jgi:repressor LexA
MRKVILKDYKKLSSKIYYFYNNEKRMPSYEELKNIFVVKSKDTVFRIVNNLVNLEYLTQDKNGRILPKENYFKKIKNKIYESVDNSNIGLELKMLGTVEAGFPTHVDAQDLENVKFEEWLIGDTNATFMLKVSGNSMIDAGICAGDFVIVERGRDVKVNDIVLAEVDGAWTLKFYKKDKQGIYLEPANKNFKSIRPKNELNIAATVVALVRKY